MKKKNISITIIGLLIIGLIIGALAYDHAMKPYKEKYEKLISTY